MEQLNDVGEMNAASDDLDVLLQAQAHVTNHIWSFANSMCLKCGVMLEIPDIIHSSDGQSMTLSKLVSALSIHPSKTGHLSRLMRGLVHSGFFKNLTNDASTEERYALTEAGHLLLKHNPLNMRDYLTGVLHPRMMKAWHFMSDWFQNENQPSPFSLAHDGTNYWEYVRQEDENGDFFFKPMASQSRLTCQVAVSKCKEVFQGLGSLVDVGGGSGVMAKAIVREFPQLKCTVFDLPHVVGELQGSSHNLNYIAGDMFVSIPPADALLLKNVLHDWNDEKCVRILKRCKEAILSNKNGGGKVILIDMVMGIQKSNEDTKTQQFLDMGILVGLTGQERNKEEWARLFNDAGFSHYKIYPSLGLQALIEVYP